MEILASIPPKIAGPIEDRNIRRCLSYKEVKEEVEWVARNKTNVDLFRETYKSTVVPAHCTASHLSGIFEDFLFLGKRVRGGVTLEDASKDWLDALRLHSDLTQKVIAEQTKCGRSFDYVQLYLSGGPDSNILASCMSVYVSGACMDLCFDFLTDGEVLDPF